ncbi:MAG: YicC family protein [Thermoguttaceae bacterium]|nr:YicC family protein [Thermoguttaceae bacterium]
MLSMTGFGGANTRRNGYVIASEIKTVNNRYFKAALRISDGFSSLEPQVESLLRSKIDRGTISVQLKIRREEGRSRFQVNDAALLYYIDRARAAAPSGSGLELGGVADFFRLPGVIEESDEAESAQDVWQAVEENLAEALDALSEMRRREGDEMEKALRRHCADLETRIAKIEELVPQVSARYREKLIERVSAIMSEHALAANEADFIREIALFVDKSDISEEIVRFRSHLEQFDAAMKMTAPCGKRLDFLTQEMFREVNTIGSKANFSEITYWVVDMKTIVEKIREMVQNVE